MEEGPHADHVVPGFAFAKRTRIVASMHGPGNDGAVTKYRTAAPRLAAMLRVAVEALDNAHGNIGKVYTYPAIALSIEGVTRHALARIEAMAKGEA